MNIPHTENQFKIIHLLFDKRRPMTVGEIARHLRIKSSAISDDVQALIDMRIIMVNDGGIGVFLSASPKVIAHRVSLYVISGS